jgi:hypothetical protein
VTPISRRLIAPFAATLVAFSVSVGVPSSAVAATCRVRNVDAGTTSVGWGDNLQTAIDEASHGDVLRVRGLCHGTFSLPTSLTLVGASAAGAPRTVLDAGGSGHVLEALDGGELRSLVLRDGWARYGGGVVVRGGRLRLTGWTVVRSNHARHGGGVAVLEGSLVLGGRTLVRGNGARMSGGGAYAAYAGRLVLTDRAQVRGNVSRGDGGGVAVDIGIVTMRAWSWIHGNVAVGAGGGIANLDGWSWFRGHARVTGNRATTDGGVYVVFGSGGVCSPGVRLSPNTPPDTWTWPVIEC